MGGHKLFVSNKDESPRIFKNSILDYFSRVHYSFPLAVYLPIILFFIYQPIFVYDVYLWAILGLFLGGMFLWTFFEYVMHRFVFHYQPTSEWGKRIHFLSHGVHHDYPNDSMRLLMPPTFSLPLAAIFYLLYYFLMGPEFGGPFFSGFVAGYLIYDLIHYATHHAKWKIPLFKKIQKHHMTHHFREPDGGYSVSVMFWDNIFGTTYKKK